MTKKLVHTMRMPVRWGDMDAMGHVNNTVYFRYIEQARISWFDHIGCAPDPAGEGPVIISAHCTFLKQIKYPGDIEIATFVGPPGRSSFEMVHDMRVLGPDGAPGELAGQGGAKIVWVDFPSEKSVPLPEPVRQLLPAA